MLPCSLKPACLFRVLALPQQFQDQFVGLQVRGCVHTQSWNFVCTFSYLPIVWRKAYHLHDPQSSHSGTQFISQFFLFS